MPSSGDGGPNPAPRCAAPAPLQPPRARPAPAHAAPQSAVHCAAGRGSAPLPAPARSGPAGFAGFYRPGFTVVKCSEPGLSLLGSWLAGRGGAHWKG